MESVTCPVCSVNILIDNPTNFFTHVKFSHSLSKNFFITCKFQNCGSQYRKFDSFKRHWNKRHGSYVKHQNVPNGNYSFSSFKLSSVICMSLLCIGSLSSSRTELMLVDADEGT
jgi:hypothetical protein